MMVGASIEQILRQAIAGEIESYKLYTRAIDLVRAEQIKAALWQLAEEEVKHKTNLMRILANPGTLRHSIHASQQAPVQDYQIGDHLVVQPLGPDSTFQDICIFASRKERQSYELYRAMAEQNGGEIKKLLEAMAKDELRHKNLVENWYEETIYQDF